MSKAILDEINKAQDKARSAVRSHNTIAIVDLSYAIGNLCSAMSMLVSDPDESSKQEASTSIQPTATKRIKLESRERGHDREWHVAVKTDACWTTAYVGDAPHAGNLFEALQSFEVSVEQQARKQERERLAAWFEARAEHWTNLARTFLERGDVHGWGTRDSMASALREDAKAIREGECWERVPIAEVQAGQEECP